ncbi:MAG: alpha/beta hydrolase [Anaerolinea sp.]|nr:alpha/beta hydrolase [Anaerolinea sp.]
MEHLYVEIGGITLHVVREGDPAHPPVILLHGFPEFWYGWRHQIPALAAAGFCVYAPDQRGYNLSEKPPRRADYALPRLSADVIGLIDWIGAARVRLAGHDWGAAVAWWTAAQHPDRIDRLAILNVPHPSVMLKNLSSNPAQILKSWYVGFFQIPLLPELALTAADSQMMATMLLRASNPGSFTDADIAQYTRAWQQPGAATAMLNWYRALVQDRPAPLADARIHVPTLILWGRNDIALEAVMAEQSLNYCDDARLIVYDDAGHFVQHDRPDAVNAELIAFFSGAQRAADEPSG